jgi:acetyl esterase/lipase
LAVQPVYIRVMRNQMKMILLATFLVILQTPARPEAPKINSIPLWPDKPPGSFHALANEQTDVKGAITNVKNPRIIVYTPEHPNGTGILVIAGGGYHQIGVGRESTPTCHWLAAHGITAFELIYRLPGNWYPEAPFQDGQRAMRLIRSQATRFNLQPNHIGILGFSAGGHLAGMTCTDDSENLYPPVDATDGTPSRPDFAALIYPVITIMRPYQHTSTCKQLVGETPTNAQRERYSVNLHVTHNTPPTFLAQCVDDPISPFENSLLMFHALNDHRVPVELHLFQKGGHSWGMGAPGTEVAAWPNLFLGFLQEPKTLLGD